MDTSTTTSRAERLQEARVLLRETRQMVSDYRYERRRQEVERHRNPPQTGAAATSSTSILSRCFSSMLGRWIMAAVARAKQASPHTNAPVPHVNWQPYIRLILCGTRDERSPFSLLRGYEDTIVKHIYSFLIEWWRPYVMLTQPAHMVGRFHDWNRPQLDMEQYGQEYEFVLDQSYAGGRIAPAVNVLMYEGGADYDHLTTILGPKRANRPEIAYTTCGHVDFPPPQDRNVNMLPFIMGDKLSLPDDLQPYYDSVISKCPIDESEIGKVGYLTVMESFVEAGKTQRRGGLHIEAPGSFTTEGTFAAAIEHHWGVGIAFSPDELHGGFFLASNMDRTCKVWNALVTEPGAVDSHGGMEDLRHLIGEGYELAAHELVWLTDKTPHEALPQPCNGYRQFFRLVTSNISGWFAAHSTPNPMVPLPDFVRIVEENKFAGNT